MYFLLDQSSHATRRERRAERRRLRRLDALSARLAELHAIRGLLQQTAEVVDAGWVQGAWFTVAGPRGNRAVTADQLDLLMERPVSAHAWSVAWCRQLVDRPPFGHSWFSGPST